jgi:hypothetical protein
MSQQQFTSKSMSKAPSKGDSTPSQIPTPTISRSPPHHDPLGRSPAQPDLDSKIPSQAARAQSLPHQLSQAQRPEQTHLSSQSRPPPSRPITRSPSSQGMGSCEIPKLRLPSFGSNSLPETAHSRSTTPGLSSVSSKEQHLYPSPRHQRSAETPQHVPHLLKPVTSLVGHSSRKTDVPALSGAQRPPPGFEHPRSAKPTPHPSPRRQYSAGIDDYLPRQPKPVTCPTENTPRSMGVPTLTKEQRHEWRPFFKLINSSHRLSQEILSSVEKDRFDTLYRNNSKFRDYIDHQVELKIIEFRAKASVAVATASHSSDQKARQAEATSPRNSVRACDSVRDKIVHASIKYDM